MVTREEAVLEILLQRHRIAKRITELKAMGHYDRAEVLQPELSRLNSRIEQIEGRTLEGRH